jgi:hypothetical protein
MRGSQMTEVKAEFQRVLTADIPRVGAMGACILALVRYVTSLPGEANGRRMVDGAMWWRATHADIGQSLGGVSHDTVRRELLKLHAAGELLSFSTEDFFGDRAQAYLVPDQPLRDSELGPDRPLRDIASPITRNRVSTSRDIASAPHAESRHLPSTGELEEESKTPLTPQPIEPSAVAVVATPAPRKRGTRLPEGWMPADSVIAAMCAEFPNLTRADLEAEHRKFSDHWLAAPGARGVKANWDATWRNWIRRANEQRPGQRNGGGPRQSTSDARYAAALALKRPEYETDNPTTRLELMR